MLNYFNRNHAVELTSDQIRHYAPSVFATEAHESRSDRFAPIPTMAVLNELKREGFVVVSAQQSRAKDETKKNFTKHMLRLRHVSDLENTGRDRMKDSHGEIILKNANDGSSTYQLMAGIYRLVCSNGMIGWSPLFDKVNVRHSGNLKKIADNVIEGTYRVLDETQNLLSVRDSWSNIQLSQDDQMALAESAHVVRFGDSEGKTDTPITPRHLLVTRRVADKGDDLWSTFNRIQENAMKGGLTAYNNNTRRMSTTREVKNIDNDVKINRALWQLADYFAKQVTDQAA